MQINSHHKLSYCIQICQIVQYWKDTFFSSGANELIVDTLRAIGFSKAAQTINPMNSRVIFSG